MSATVINTSTPTTTPRRNTTTGLIRDSEELFDEMSVPHNHRKSPRLMIGGWPKIPGWVLFNPQFVNSSQQINLWERQLIINRRRVLPSPSQEELDRRSHFSWWYSCSIARSSYQAWSWRRFSCWTSRPKRNLTSFLTNYFFTFNIFTFQAHPELACVLPIIWLLLDQPQFQSPAHPFHHPPRR